MKIKDIIATLEGYAPVALADEDDQARIGLQIGSLNAECTGVLTCLDCTSETVSEAEANDCNLIISHHPLLFHAVSEIEVDCGRGKLISEIIKKNITVYSAHTNMDKCEKGINERLIKLFGGEKTGSDGCLFFASVAPVTLGALAKRVAETLSDATVTLAGDPDAVTDRFAVCSGGGASTAAFPEVLANGGVYITGDVPHHVYVDAAERGVFVIGFSHFGSEIIVNNLFREILAGDAATADVKVVAADQTRPYRTLEEI